LSIFNFNIFGNVSWGWSSSTWANIRILIEPLAGKVGRKYDFLEDVFFKPNPPCKFADSLIILFVD